MVSYRSLRHIGLMTAVVAAAIMAAGVAWAATLTCTIPESSFNHAGCPTGSCNLSDGAVNCVVDKTAQTVTCSEPCNLVEHGLPDVCYVIGGIGGTNGTASLTVRFQSASDDAQGVNRNGQMNVLQVSAGAPAGGIQISSFTYTFTFTGKKVPLITITEANCNGPL